VAALAGEARQHGGQRRLVEQVQVAAQHAPQVVGEVAGVGVLELGQLVEGLDDERELGGPAAVDGGLADAGAGGDALDGEAREADLAEQLEGGAQDRLVRLLAARAAGVGPPRSRSGGLEPAGFSRAWAFPWAFAATVRLPPPA
jgi:hypothetical protein